MYVHIYLCVYTNYFKFLCKCWLVNLVIEHKFLLVFSSTQPKWAKEEAFIPRHASETPGSLQTLCRSFTSPQLDCLYISDGERSGAEIDASSEVMPLPLHVMRSEHKGRGQPAPACSTHLFQLPACVCVFVTERWKCTRTRSSIHHYQNLNAKFLSLPSDENLHFFMSPEITWQFHFWLTDPYKRIYPGLGCRGNVS